MGLSQNLSQTLSKPLRDLKNGPNQTLVENEEAGGDPDCPNGIQDRMVTYTFKSMAISDLIAKHGSIMGGDTQQYAHRI
jgi:hypothetical protein